MFLKLERGAKELGLGVDKGETFALDQLLRREFAVALVELRLRVEEVKLGDPAAGKKQDDLLGLGRKMREFRGEGGFRGRGCREKGMEGKLAKADASPGQCRTTGERKLGIHWTVAEDAKSSDVQAEFFANSATGKPLVLILSISALRDGFIEVEEDIGHMEQRGELGEAFGVEWRDAGFEVAADGLDEFLASLWVFEEAGFPG